jgi:hypothetical protein
VANGWKHGTDFEHFEDEGALHTETAWSKRAWRALEFVLGDKP